MARQFAEAAFTAGDGRDQIDKDENEESLMHIELNRKEFLFQGKLEFFSNYFNGSSAEFSVTRKALLEAKRAGSLDWALYHLPNFADFSSFDIHEAKQEPKNDLTWMSEAEVCGLSTQARLSSNVTNICPMIVNERGSEFDSDDRLRDSVEDTGRCLSSFSGTNMKFAVDYQEQKSEEPKNEVRSFENSSLSAEGEIENERDDFDESLFDEIDFDNDSFEGEPEVGDDSADQSVSERVNGPLLDFESILQHCEELDPFQNEDCF